MNAGKNSDKAVQELWSLCGVLRDDGVSAQDYVNELTLLLFIKMMEETGRDAEMPPGTRWSELLAADRALEAYVEAVRRLSVADGPPLNGVLHGARTSLRNPSSVTALLAAVDRMDWFDEDAERLGDVYEGLLERIATDRKSSTGQYFTPRPLVECIVEVMQPAAGETIQDPAAGTGGFLIAAHAQLKRKDEDAHAAFCGVELVPDTYRLLVMNLTLHGIDPVGVRLGDALTAIGETLPPADLILTNPPFGVARKGRRPDRGDFAVTSRSSNKQLAFVEHVVRGLAPGGRAAVIVPDNVLFASGAARELRTWMLDACDVHTLLRLPSGIFYAQGVKTCVLFLQRPQAGGDATRAVRIYDMRAGLPAFGRARPLRRSDFDEFVEGFHSAAGAAGNHTAAQNANDRWRTFTREEIARRDDKLDPVWISSIDASELALEEPWDMLEAARGHLARALVGIDELASLLEASA
ncbi:type I restriction-modification system subunit M [Sphingomonas sp. PL-96]|uniref:class I SAM-dependent DNA methyltransferase n=1 Tax=Sphingomonas sp. PL-96 TaxID=2887201 RepID=UPI001E4E0113|nr:N-6 DNA methylase [Sphingomonas sp. PL-96]MCC2976263.1 type I restriction-modification system subunit M [Sphingomonas sp. PL-96]